MTDAWKKWEGQIVDGEFPLREFVHGSDHSGVFLTDRPSGDPQQAAIKLISADPQSAKLQLSRWEQAAKISHPHLLRLYESGRCRLGDAEMLYAVLEYAGEDLSQILPQRPLTPAETREMLKPVVEALAHLHAAGFVHGHLKPADVMVAEEQVKISSDGLCRSGERSLGGRKQGAYDPPESSTSGITPAADIWALGMTVAEALTQRLPVWERFQETEPALPDSLPADFRELVRHCLKRDPQRRWSVAEIERWLQPGAPATQKPAAETPRSQAAVRSKWRHAMPAIAFALAAVVLIGIISLLNRRPGIQPASQAPAQAETQPAKPAPAAEAPVAKNQAADRGAPEVPAAAALANASARTQPKPSTAKSSAGEVSRGEVIQQVLPEVSEKARATIQGRVRVSVKVQVDSSGHVTSVDLESPGPSKYFADAAQRAAHQWQFSPATVDGQSAESEWILRFEFTSSGTTVRPAPKAP